MNDAENVKDPKDMTASELLREADSSPCSMCHLVMSGDESCATTGCASWAYRLADKIDGEVQGAYERGLTASEENDFVVFDHEEYGWPAPRSDENLKVYIERCFLPRPLYEDGEPVQFGDEIELHYRSGSVEKGRLQEVFINSGPVMILSFVGANTAREYRYDTELDTIKRLAPEALGADGKPIKAGETVYLANDWIEGTVKELLVDEKAYIEWCDETFTPGVPCKNLTHTPPDTQERIDEDAKKEAINYWGCVGLFCEECPATIDGENALERYRVDSCVKAQKLDLLRRQRELDKRTGGE